MLNRFKSIFISAYMTSLFAITIYALIRLYADGFNFVWFGAFIAAGLPAGFFAYAMANLLLKRMARTSENMPLIMFGAAVGAGLSIFGNLQAQTISIPALACIIASFGGWLVYIFWYSRFGREENRALAVGSKLPSFELEDEHGNNVSSDSFRGKPALLLFYRGNWCPLCMSQIKEIAARYRELADKGVQIVLISPQPHKFTRNLAKKFKVPFTFLVDAGNRAARQLDIAALAGLPAGMELLGYDSDTVMPTLIITDSEGRIIFADLTDNYRVRPEPDSFLRVLKEHT